MKRSPRIMAVFSLALVMLLGFSQGALAKGENVLVEIGKDIVIAKGVEVDQAVAIGGDLTVLGKVKGNAVAIGGNLTLKSSAEIGEDAVCIGGKLEKEEGAQVQGDAVNIGILKFPCFGKRALFRLGIGGLGGLLGWLSWWGIFFGITKFIVELILAILLVAFLPRQISVISDSLKKNWWRAILIGILVLICAPLLMVLVGITIVGLPLIPVIVMVLAVAGLLGRVSIFLLVGERLHRAFNPKPLSSIVTVILGAIALNLVGLVPILGPVIYALVLVFGLGAVFTTRFGTRS
ncbi:hypothetical protein ES703_75336 [subsurface metagenome]